MTAQARPIVGDLSKCTIPSSTRSSIPGTSRTTYRWSAQAMLPLRCAGRSPRGAHGSLRFRRGREADLDKSRVMITILNNQNFKRGIRTHFLGRQIHILARGSASVADPVEGARSYTKKFPPAAHRATQRLANQKGVSKFLSSRSALPDARD